MNFRFLASLLSILLLPILLGLRGSEPASPGYRFARQSAPYTKTVLGWMVSNGVAKAGEAVLVDPASAADVRAFFSLAGRSNRLNYAIWEQSAGGPARLASLAEELNPLQRELSEFRGPVELLIQNQVVEALSEVGLASSTPGGQILFPPLLFRFETPPRLLVVSRRDRIERLGTVLLDPNLSLDEAERLETRIAGDRYSTLVTRLGGLGAYPSMVPENSDVRWTLRTVAHEWAHQFLAFRPVGWRYAFGSEGDGRMVAVNETAAEILGREVGDSVFRKLYRESGEEAARSSPDQELFRRTMRELRKKVDVLLTQGKPDEAENLMESTRESLVEKGFSLRKLNQAYFAFHDSYADEPAFAGPQGEDIAGKMREVRERSSSVGDFLWRVSEAGSYDEFSRLAKGS